MIVQYQQPDYANADAAAVSGDAADQANPRVTDENAPVKILVPTHPVFNFPKQDHRRRFQWLGAGAQRLRVHDIRFADTSRCWSARIPASRRVRGAEVYADVGKGAVRLHGLLVVPAAARRRPWRVPSVREPDQPVESAALTRRPHKPLPDESATTIAATPTTSASSTPTAANAIHRPNGTPAARSTAMSPPLVGVNSSVSPAPV